MTNETVAPYIGTEEPGQITVSAPVPKDPSEDLVRNHTDLLTRIVLDAENQSRIKAGSEGCVIWEPVFESGKQQPVSIVKFSFPEGQSIELVFRPTKGQFADIYMKYPVVRKYFPKLYMQIPVEDYRQNVLVLQRFAGWDEKHEWNSFQSLITDAAMFEQLCQQVFEMANALLHEPLMLQDIAPAKGHNVIYDTVARRFQLFDVDTVKYSDEPFVKKFMDFINPGHAGTTKEEAKYIMRMMQIYQRKYPKMPLSYMSAPYTRGTYHEVKDANRDGNDTLIYPTDPHYEQAYLSIDWRGPPGKDKLYPLQLQTEKGQAIISIRQDILDAVEADDAQTLYTLLQQYSGNILEREFVPQVFEQ